MDTDDPRSSRRGVFQSPATVRLPGLDERASQTQAGVVPGSTVPGFWLSFSGPFVNTWRVFVLTFLEFDGLQISLLRASSQTARLLVSNT